MSVRRIGHASKRHPTCPECGYDLVATVASEGRVCPECGCEFRWEELPRTPAPDDWTPARGLRRLVLRVAIRSAVCLGPWVVLLVLASILCAWGDRTGSLTQRVLVWLLCVGLVLIGSAVVGMVVGRRIDEAAGIRTPLALAAPIAGAAAILVAGAAVAEVLGYGKLAGAGLTLVAVLLAVVLIVRGYLTAEY